MSPEIREAFVDAGGIRTRYLVAGNGPPVVLLHGTSLAIDARATWFRTIPALARHHRVFAPDMIGFGGTEAAADGRHVLRLERCGFVRAFLDALGLTRCALVGHSEGAFVATRLAIETPDLVSALVIVTSGATAPATGTAEDAVWGAASAAAYDVAGGCATEEGFVSTIGRLSATNPPEYLDILRANYRQARRNGQFERLVAASVRGDYESYVRVQEETLFPHLSKIEARILLIWARADVTVPISRGIALLDLLPGADMHVLAGAAHMAMIDRPGAFNRVLRGFLSADDTV